MLDDSIGLMACGPYSFDLVEGATRSRISIIPLSVVTKDTLTKMIDIIIANDIIEDSTSAEWNSPFILASKGDADGD